MQRYDFLEQQIEDCEARIAVQIDDLTPSDDPADDDASDESTLPEATGVASNTAGYRIGGARRAMHDKALIMALHGMMSVDLTAIPTIGTGIALTIASEIGPDFSAFPSAQHFCSWLGLAPGTPASSESVPLREIAGSPREAAPPECRGGHCRPNGGHGEGVTANTGRIRAGISP